MDVFEHYLKAVGSFLPADQRDDILRELSADIQSQVEEKEAEQGRSLNESELQAILKRVGHPLVVASRYRQDNRSVAFGRQFIGPVLFPAYKKVLIFNLTATYGIVAVVFASLFIAGQHLSFSNVASVFLYQFLIQFSVVTAIFALVDSYVAKHPDKWSPQDTVPGQLKFDLMQQISRDAIPRPGDAALFKPVPRFESICNFVISAGVLVWLSAVPRYPFLLFGPGASFLGLGPVWKEAYPAMLIVTVAAMAGAFVNLCRPDWVRFRDLARIALDSASVGIMGVLLRGSDWVVFKWAGAPEMAAAITNLCIYITLWISVAVTAAFIAIKLFRFVWREVKTRKFRTTGEASRA